MIFTLFPVAANTQYNIESSEINILQPYHLRLEYWYSYVDNTFAF